MSWVPTVWQKYYGRIFLELKSEPVTFVENRERNFVPGSDESTIYAEKNARFYRLEKFLPLPPNPLSDYFMNPKHDPAESRMRVLVPATIDGQISTKGLERMQVQEKDWLYSFRNA